MNQDYTQDGLSLANVCPMCIEQEQLCVDCVDQADARLTNKAYALVDEGLSVEGDVLYKADENPSASDWVSSETVIKRKGRKAVFTEKWQDESMHLLELTVKFIDQDDPWLLRKEYLPPIAQLMDGGTYEELWELDDMTQRAREVECQWCHLMTPKAFNDCQDCDRPLEGNVR